jgi:hypothetical protein
VIRVTLAEFSNELRRLHCIDGWMIPELQGDRLDAFLRNPVHFFLRADDATQEAIWAAMVRDKNRIHDWAAMVRPAL